MDEMNLAPVEQYFAEFLSVLESRKLLSDGTITSEPLIKADIFSKYADQLHRDLDITDTETYKAVYDRLKNDGLRLPSNLIVVGTVNMDETTHQFSRKVIDRAMTIEMNIENAETPFKNFFEGGDALHYYDNPQPKDLFLPKVVQASEALSILRAEDASYLKENVPGLLHSLNSALNGTPFKIAYRVQNELILYFFSLREESPHEAAEALLAQAMDAILMMKVLPRIEATKTCSTNLSKRLPSYGKLSARQAGKSPRCRSVCHRHTSPVSGRKKNRSHGSTLFPKRRRQSGNKGKHRRDTANCWRRFSARVGENASRYCSYRSSLAGRLAIALPSQSHRLTDTGEEAAMQWDNLPPVFYETAVYNVNIYLSDIESEPRVVHKLKEVSDLFTAISVGDNKWVLTAPLSFSQRTRHL